MRAFLQEEEEEEKERSKRLALRSGKQRSLSPSTKEMPYFVNFSKKRAVMANGKVKSPGAGKVCALSEKSNAECWHDFLQKQKKINRDPIVQKNSENFMHKEARLSSNLSEKSQLKSKKQL